MENSPFFNLVLERKNGEKSATVKTGLASG
jgi:hypothetical protein